MLCVLARPFDFPTFRLPLWLRIDVDPRHMDPDRELDEQAERLACMPAMATIDALGRRWPGLRFLAREADGEHYIYVQDAATDQLIGYTVFNRLVELDRRADRHLRAPHSKYRTAYQRKGIATTVYQWWLDAGRCLISGARQSAGAHALWERLANAYPRFYVDLDRKIVRYLGPSVTEPTREALNTRMILLGAGWSDERLGQLAGVRMPHPVS